MKTTLIALLCTAALGYCQEPTKPEAGKPAQKPAHAETTATAQDVMPVGRTLTATDGRTIDVVIVAKTETAITAKRADGKEFEITLDKLSDADKAFVAKLQAPAPAPLIPFGITMHTNWRHYYGNYALIRVEDIIYAIYAKGIDSKHSIPNDPCYYSIQYSVTKITPGRPNQIITEAISHQINFEKDTLNCGKFKLQWGAADHDGYWLNSRTSTLAGKKFGPPPGAEYYNQLLPTLDSIKELDPNRWVPIPVK